MTDFEMEARLENIEMIIQSLCYYLYLYGNALRDKERLKEFIDNLVKGIEDIKKNSLKYQVLYSQDK